MRHTGRVGRVESIDVHRNVKGRRYIEPEIPAQASSFYHLDAETLELVTMMIVDGADSHLNQAIGKPLFHDSSKRRSVGSRVALISMVNIGMRVYMEDGQIGVTPAYCAHDRMSYGMVAAEANQWIA